MAKQRMIGLDDNEYPINTKGSARKPSKLHQRAMTVIKGVYPASVVLEECSIKIDRRKTLYLDIFLPTYGIVIEVNGKQHFERCSHFQSDQQFYNQRRNDIMKADWAELNNLRLVNFNYDESDDEWRQKLNGTDAG